MSGVANLSKAEYLPLDFGIVGGSFRASWEAQGVANICYPNPPVPDTKKIKMKIRAFY